MAANTVCLLTSINNTNHIKTGRDKEDTPGESGKPVVIMLPEEGLIMAANTVCLLTSINNTNHIKTGRDKEDTPGESGNG